MTRQDIFQKRIDTGNAKYEDKQVYRVIVYKEYDIRYTVKLGMSGRGFTLQSITEVLFGPSNFFEVMFGEKVIDASEHCPREPRQCCCGHGLTETEYHKSQCAISEDKLQYLIDNLPN